MFAGCLEHLCYKGEKKSGQTMQRINYHLLGSVLYRFAELCVSVLPWGSLIAEQFRNPIL